MHMPTRVWDPLYGRIDFSKFEYKLILLPEVQRLRNVRMCNINSLLVTGASEISRFEHTIGVLHLANQWIMSHKISDDDALDLRAAAVLHDMQTGPFGHSLQYVLEENEVDGDFIHDDISHGKNNRYHQDLLARTTFAGRAFSANLLLGERWENVGSLIKGKNRLGPLIAGTMDLDNIDNVVRLAYHVGVAENRDAQVCIDLARDIDVERGTLAFSEKTIPQITRWQDIRNDLYNLLLLDWAEFSAKAMFTKAVEIAIKGNLLGADSWVHTDSELLKILENEGIGDHQYVGELVRRIRLGDLFEPICLLGSSSIEKYPTLTDVNVKHRIENEIVEFAKKMFGVNIKVIFHLILDKGKTRRAVDVKIKESSEVVIVGENSEKLLIGLFLSKGGLPLRVMEGLERKIYDILDIEGVANISPLPDPMGVPSPIKIASNQLDLI